MSENAKVGWVFEPKGKMGGAEATAWKDTLTGQGIGAEERLAREAIQNSVDATLPGGKTEMVFRQQEQLDSDELERFIDAYGLRESGSPLERLPKLGLQEDNSFQKIANQGLEASIQRMTIEDINTCGLTKEDGVDRLFALCLQMGRGTLQTDSPDRGGSYGFGKTVYQAASDCRSFIVYSRIEPTEELPEVTHRLFGCSFFDGHDDFTGRAWFGVIEDDDDVCGVIENEQAEELADELGFIEREEKEFGTSIMIIGNQVDMGLLKTAVEDFWFPRMAADKLDVLLFGGADGYTDFGNPNPSAREDLKPYLKCFHMAVGKSNDKKTQGWREGLYQPSEGDEEQETTFIKTNDLKRGSIGLKLLETIPDKDETGDDNETEDDRKRRERFNKTVALIRPSPLMVVTYLNTGGNQLTNFAGVFLADEQAELSLQLSEPSTHSNWDPDNERLIQALSTNRITEGQRKLVQSILQSIKKEAKKFQTNHAENYSPSVVSGSSALQRALNKFMGSGRRGRKGQPPTSNSNFETNVDTKTFKFDIDAEDPNKKVVSGFFTVGLSETYEKNTGKKEAAALVNIGLIPVLDDNPQRPGHDRSLAIGASVVEIDGQPVPNDQASIRVYRGRKRSITFISEPYSDGGRILELGVSPTLSE